MSAAAGIGTLNEGSLHASLKLLYSEPGDAFEVPLNGFVVDIIGQEQLIEIQTGSFAALGNKLDHLLCEHRLLLVHPIAVETFIERPGHKPKRSPKRGTIYTLFEQLVSVPTLLDHPHLSLEAVLVSVTKVQVHDPDGRRGRGGYRTVDRRLREVLDRQRFDSAADLMRLVPTDLPRRFTTADLAECASISRAAAQQMAYCMRPLGLFTEVGRTRSGIEYSLTV